MSNPEPADPILVDDVLGCLPGKAVMWFNRNGKRCSGCYVYPGLREALLDIGRRLWNADMTEAVINYKHPDGEFLEVWVLRREMLLPKHKPFDWGKLMFWRKK